MKILCIGQLVADILVYPVESVKYDVDTVCVDTIEVKNGGDAMNTAVSLGYLGNEVSFTGRIGKDDFGRLLSDRLFQAGVKAKLIADREKATSSTIVLINSDGERTFLHCAGANQSLVPDDVEETDYENAGIVHIGGTYILPGIDGEGAAGIFREAHAGSAMTSMDVTYDVSGKWLHTIRPCLSELDFFLPSIGEASRITGKESPEEIAEALLGFGVKNVVIKLGSAGCYVKNREVSFYQKSYPTLVKDTTGAGDTFAAGFLTGLAEERPLRECAKLACAAGSVCVSHMGATTDTLSRERVREIAGV